MALFNLTKILKAFANPPSAYTVAALCVSLLALVLAVKNYWRKAGTLVRGTFSTSSSRDCDDKYLSSLVIENLKDRAVTVFAIYLRMGSNYYVEIESFEAKPLILRPFETYQKEYGPIEFYGINSDRIKLDKLFADRKIKKRLVLSTGDGKYVVPDNLRRWTPVYQFFRNHLTAVVRPVRAIYKDTAVGGNVKYVLELVSESGTEEILCIRPDDYQLKIFKNFQLTKESLATQETLEGFLQQQVDDGKLTCQKCTVMDMQEWRAKNRDFYARGRTFEANLFGPFHYHVLGRLSTMYLTWKQKRQNAHLLK
jgi:hypothetical protein